MSFPGFFIHLWRSRFPSGIIFICLRTSFIFLYYVSMYVVWGSSSGYFGNEFFQLSCVWICLYFAVTLKNFCWVWNSAFAVPPPRPAQYFFFFREKKTFNEKCILLDKSFCSMLMMRKLQLVIWEKLVYIIIYST